MKKEKVYMVVSNGGSPYHYFDIGELVTNIGDISENYYVGKGKCADFLIQQSIEPEDLLFISNL